MSPEPRQHSYDDCGTPDCYACASQERERESAPAQPLEDRLRTLQNNYDREHRWLNDAANEADTDLERVADKILEMKRELAKLRLAVPPAAAQPEFCKQAKYTREQVAAMNLPEEEAQAKLRECVESVPPAAETAQPQHCHADRDGDCSWKDCPQAGNRQEYCPLAISDEAETAMTAEQIIGQTNE